MRTVRYTARFRTDYRRALSGRHGRELDLRLEDVVALLANDSSLPLRNLDHGLTGNWSDHRDCHLWPDLILIYRKPDGDSLELVRLGSHSSLGF